MTKFLASKAEGLREIASACGGSEQSFQILRLEHIETLSQSAAQAISIVKFDKDTVRENGGTNGQGATVGFLQNMAKTLPPSCESWRTSAASNPQIARILRQDCRARLGQTLPRRRIQRPRRHRRPLLPGPGLTVRAAALALAPCRS